MPCLAAFINICPRTAEGTAIRAAALSGGKDVRSTVSQLPIADRSLCNVNQEGHASCKDADEGSGNPSLTGIESGECMTAETFPRCDDP